MCAQAPRRTATLQLSAPERSAADPERSSSVWGTTFIFHLCHMKPCRGAAADADITSSYMSTRDLVDGVEPAAGEGAVPGGARDSADSLRTANTGDESGTPGCITVMAVGASSLDPSRDGVARVDAAAAAAAATAAANDNDDDFVLPESLVRVLCDPGILLAGVGIGGDVSRLEREYKQLRERGGMNGLVDLSELAKRKARSFCSFDFVFAPLVFSRCLGAYHLRYSLRQFLCRSLLPRYTVWEFWDEGIHMFMTYLYSGMKLLVAFSSVRSWWKKQRSVSLLPPVGS